MPIKYVFLPRSRCSPAAGPPPLDAPDVVAIPQRGSPPTRAAPSAGRPQRGSPPARIAPRAVATSPARSAHPQRGRHIPSAAAIPPARPRRHVTRGPPREQAEADGTENGSGATVATTRTLRHRAQCPDTLSETGGSTLSHAAPGHGNPAPPRTERNGRHHTSQTAPRRRDHAQSGRAAQHQPDGTPPPRPRTKRTSSTTPATQHRPWRAAQRRCERNQPRRRPTDAPPAGPRRHPAGAPPAGPRRHPAGQQRRAHPAHHFSPAVALRPYVAPSSRGAPGTRQTRTISGF